MSNFLKYLVMFIKLGIITGIIILGGMIFSIIYGLVAELYSFKVMYLSCSIIVTIGFFFLTKMLHKEIVYDDR